MERSTNHGIAAALQSTTGTAAPPPSLPLHTLLLPQKITISFVQSRKSAHCDWNSNPKLSSTRRWRRKKIYHQLQQHIQSSSLPILTCSCILPLPIDFNGGCNSFRQSSRQNYLVSRVEEESFCRGKDRSTEEAIILLCIDFEYDWFVCIYGHNYFQSFWALPPIFILHRCAPTKDNDRVEGDESFCKGGLWQ